MSNLRYKPWPFAKGNRCIRWADNCYGKLEAAIKEDPDLKGVIVWNRIYDYYGPILTFRVHAFLEIEIEGCDTFYADNALYGGSDDHVFIDFPGDDLLPPGTRPPERPGSWSPYPGCGPYFPVNY